MNSGCKVATILILIPVILAGIVLILSVAGFLFAAVFRLL